ncbi:RmlC-like cupin domain-containing protein [Limtongia smithiae]|uniref:RmlC-like cupin domain-containing protein n=1 Tax=Limtongia smithiae TaxID=1125753 RepID=UPI0034CEDACA
MIASSIPRLLTPPGKAGQPYVTSLYDGEMFYIPLSLSNTRLLVTGDETENAFAIVGSGGTASAPIGFHFHREAHDVFLCLQGQMNVWAANQCRTMNPGDFASVPPTVVHQYQIISQHTEFIGLIVPGNWIDFFRFVGEPYAGCLFPTSDARNPMETIVPKIIAASEKFDMVPVRDHPFVAPQPWKEGEDISIPDGVEPYFLRAYSGQKWILGGILDRPLITETQSNGRFSIASIQGSVKHKSLLRQASAIKFDKVHHCILVVEGRLDLEIEGTKVVVAAQELAYIPSKTAFSLGFGSSHAQAYIFANGGGIEKIIRTLGTTYEPHTIPDEPVGEHTVEMLRALGQEQGFTIV